ncbi:MAG: hypothetical protein KF760_20740 [Candidatus Eremiobacteraeota bacterium]|nr:hypothetical protein [Candidatus Eremiobacteraeota bacterium]MCW5870468.1 hypothetical protein [Candidatus Eremiobacteraeota bacterium]
MSALLYWFGGGAVTLAVGGLFYLLGGRRPALRVSRGLAAIATGLPLVMFACAFLAGDADEDGRSAGMLALASLTMLLASLSCWVPVWIFRDPVAGSAPSDPGLNREGPPGANS